MHDLEATAPPLSRRSGRGDECAKVRPPRLLLVEDDRGLAASLGAGLRRDGFSVTEAYDGAQGLALARAATFDVLLLDLMLPKLSGIDVCRQLRADQVPTAIVALTASADPDKQLAAEQAGVDAYVTKPFSHADLVG
ncbi:MAG: response regulator, partial [Acidimicrobiia bacterium]|nr:response regulator [Acidimicrobiia bacterium]